MNDTQPQYDLFLSYNSPDHVVVSEIRQQLQQLSQPLNTFIDRESLTLGKNWFDEIQHALLNCKAVAVFYGKHGLGRWQNLEMMLALDTQATTNSEDSILVIPVLLPGANLEQAPRFLLQNNFLDFRSGPTEKGLIRLVQTVQGQAIHLDSLPQQHELSNPYRALNYFREEDAPLFFGRELMAQRLLEKVKSNQLVALVGNSGTGKSSLVRAGLVPLLRQQHHPDSSWEVLICIPALDNVNPFHNLARVFLESWGGQRADIFNNRPKTEATLRVTLSLADAIDQTIQHSQAADKVLLIIDQFEEILKFDSHADTKSTNQSSKGQNSTEQTDFELFEELLLNAIQTERCTVLLTIRGDYYGTITERHSGLAEAIASGTIALSRMDEQQLTDVIEKPAQLCGAQFQEGLVDRILEDVRQQPGNLALLEFALSELWDHRDGPRLTHSAYQDKVGKLEGAISNKANEILQSSKIKNPQLALAVLTRLVDVSISETEGGDTRQRVAMTEFDDQERALLEPFIQARLLVASGGQNTGESPDAADQPQQTPTLEVAHEALIWHWPALQQAINDKRPLLLWRQSIKQQYQQWQQHASKNSEQVVLAGYQLQQGIQWLDHYPNDLGEDEQEFIRFSQSIASIGRRKIHIAVGMVIGLIGLLMVSFLWAEHNNASWRLLPEIVATRFQYHWGKPPQWIPEMKRLDGGTFQMGSEESDQVDERPQHPVTIKPFSIGVYEVTFDEYQPFFDHIEQKLYRCPERKPELGDENWGKGKRPAIFVDWDDASCYTNWLSLLTGSSFRLPTEAEWEYAVRAGTTGNYYWGDLAIADYAWFNENSGDTTRPVGEKRPNLFGLYDLSGNVWEWVQDCWHGNYHYAPDDGSAWEQANGDDCTFRVLRGGAWNNTPFYLRSVTRYWINPYARYSDMGFRLAQDLP